MTVFTKQLNAVRQFRTNIIKIALDEVLENEPFIVDLVSEDQLFEKGIRGDEVFIADFAPYSPVTIEIKQAKGQPTDRVTLRDEGDYHASFYIKIGSDHWEIKASDWKAEELSMQYGEEILQLTDENLTEVIWSYIYTGLMLKFRNAVSK